MKRYIVKRPKDTVEVLILPNKDGSGYQYVNLTKGHICPCKFKTELEALRDMDKKVSEDKVLYYEEIEEIKEKMTKLSMSEEEMLKRKYTRPYEKRIAELEEKLANADYQLEGRDLEIKELEKENAELKERLLKVENAYKRKSEAEWRLNDLYQKSLTAYANAEKCSREYFTRYRDMLDRYIKAKEIIKKFSEFVNNEIEYDPEHPQEHTDLWNKLCEEAEQFLNKE